MKKMVYEIVRDFKLGDIPKDYIDKEGKKIGLVNLRELAYQKVLGFNYDAVKNEVIIQLDTKKEWLEG